MRQLLEDWDKNTEELEVRSTFCTPEVEGPRAVAYRLSAMLGVSFAAEDCYTAWGKDGTTKEYEGENTVRMHSSSHTKER
jgi:hypothetical protein